MMGMGIINFSDTYTKLMDPEPGKQFTTFRAYTSNKELYYKNHINDIFEITLLKKQLLGYARLLEIDFARKNELSLEFWRADIRDDITFSDVTQSMLNFYGNPNPYGIILKLEWEEPPPAVIKQGVLF